MQARGLAAATTPCPPPASSTQATPAPTGAPSTAVAVASASQSCRAQVRPPPPPLQHAQCVKMCHFTPCACRFKAYWAQSGIASSSDGSRLAALTTVGYLFTSANGGRTWTQGTRPGGLSWLSSVACSSDGKRLIVGGTTPAITGGVRIVIWTSPDAGVTWFDAYTFPVSSQTTAVASASSGGRLVALAPGNFIVTSADGGASWTERSTGGGPSRNWLAVASSADGSKLVATDQGTVPSSISPASVYTSSDGGATWVDRTLAVWAVAPRAVCQAVASSGDGNKLAAACGSSILTSVDAGTTWAVSKKRLGESNVVASSSDGFRLVFADRDGYVHTSTNGGATWTMHTALSWQSAERWQAVASSADGMRLAVGGANSYIYTTADGGVTWDPAPPPPPAPVTVSRWAACHTEASSDAVQRAGCAGAL